MCTHDNPFLLEEQRTQRALTGLLITFIAITVVVLIAGVLL